MPGFDLGGFCCIFYGWYGSLAWGPMGPARIIIIWRAMHLPVWYASFSSFLPFFATPLFFLLAIAAAPSRFLPDEQDDSAARIVNVLFVFHHPPEGAQGGTPWAPFTVTYPMHL